MTVDCACGERIEVSASDVGGSLLAHYRAPHHRAWRESQEGSAIHVLPVLEPHVQRADCPCGTRDTWIGEQRIVTHSAVDPRAWRNPTGNWIEGYWPSTALEAQLDAAKEATTDGPLTRLTPRVIVRAIPGYADAWDAECAYHGKLTPLPQRFWQAVSAAAGHADYWSDAGKAECGVRPASSRSGDPALPQG